MQGKDRQDNLPTKEQVMEMFRRLTPAERKMIIGLIKALSSKK